MMFMGRTCAGVVVLYNVLFDICSLIYLFCVHLGILLGFDYNNKYAMECCLCGNSAVKLTITFFVVSWYTQDVTSLFKNVWIFDTYIFVIVYNLPILFIFTPIYNIWFAKTTHKNMMAPSILRFACHVYGQKKSLEKQHTSIHKKKYTDP